MPGSSKFVGISPSDVATLKAGDPVVVSAGTATTPLTYASIRANFGRDKGLWSSLDRGRAILDSTDKLDQYLYSYAPMICRQWKYVLDNVSLSGSPTALVDYGCGQALAGLLVRDCCGSDIFDDVEKIILIEPSAHALVRAEAIYRSLAPDADIVAVCGKLDDVDADVFSYASSGATLHLFSNVLDIGGFNQYAVMDKALTNGEHELLAVSPDREFEGGSGRFHGLKDVVEHDELKEWLHVSESKIEKFYASPPSQQPAIFWHGNLTVSK